MYCYHLQRDIKIRSKNENGITGLEMDKKQQNQSKLCLKLQVLDLKDDEYLKGIDDLRRRIVALEGQVAEVVIKKT